MPNFKKDKSKFQLRSGNSPAFKKMGSSPYKFIGPIMHRMSGGGGMAPRQAGMRGQGARPSGPGMGGMFGGALGGAMSLARRRKEMGRAGGGGGGGRRGGFGRGLARAALGGIGSLFSDVRLKENISKTGTSKSGIPIYEFNYIGSNDRYSGAMAQDLLKIQPNVVMIDKESGFYKVDYNKIDVDMRLLN